MGAGAAGDVDGVEVLLEQGLGGRGRLGVPQVGELQAGVGGVELARDVGVRLPVTHQEQSHLRPRPR